MNRKLLFIVGCFLILVLYFSLFGSKGLLTSLKLVKEYQEVLLDIESTKHKNLELQKEIDFVENGSFYVEKKAREVLGLVRDDEIIYEFND
ncbi:MAG: septum formation initiator family protein [Deltaproteobacteria bacterium]|nr:septum formation initiator family protein [Deltaproteobacteria bacterium]